VRLAAAGGAVREGPRGQTVASSLSDETAARRATGAAVVLLSSRMERSGHDGRARHFRVQAKALARARGWTRRAYHKGRRGNRLQGGAGTGHKGRPKKRGTCAPGRSARATISAE